VSAAAPPPGLPRRSCDIRALAILTWTLAFCLLATIGVHLVGLKYVQGVVWPTDLYAFQQTSYGPLDVVVLGSSRAAFGISPSALDACLGRELRRPVRSANLARTFATAYTADFLARDLLVGEKVPKILLIADGPEFFDEYNHRLAVITASAADLPDVPRALLHAPDLYALLGALRPLIRGPETLALYLSGRYDVDQHVRWMMLHHGGGQFCYGSTACAENNRQVMSKLRFWWQTAMIELVPSLTETRFPSYEVGSGAVHEHLLNMFSWARERDVQVVFADLPRHREFVGRVPKGVREAYQGHLELLQAEHGLIVYQGGGQEWIDARTRYVDVEHLDDGGCRKFTHQICKELLAPLLEGEGGD